MPNPDTFCSKQATVSIRPNNASDPYDVTYACNEHIAPMLGHVATDPEPDYYQVTVIDDPSLVCCHVA